MNHNLQEEDGVSEVGEAPLHVVGELAGSKGVRELEFGKVIEDGLEVVVDVLTEVVGAVVKDEDVLVDPTQVVLYTLHLDGEHVNARVGQELGELLKVSLVIGRRPVPPASQQAHALS